MQVFLLRAPLNYRWKSQEVCQSQTLLKRKFCVWIICLELTGWWGKKERRFIYWKYFMSCIILTLHTHSVWRVNILGNPTLSHTNITLGEASKIPYFKRTCVQTGPDRGQPPVRLKKNYYSKIYKIFWNIKISILQISSKIVRFRQLKIGER